jgi:acetoin utilization deacetylase AcuC-like enzyme
MKTIYSPAHHGHAGQGEFAGGALVEAFEKPERAEIIRARVEAVGLGPVVGPAEHGLAMAKRVHLPRYVDFLSEVWPAWSATGRTHPALPSFWRAPGMVDAASPRKEPESIDGKLGFWSFDAGCAMVAGSWDAIRASCDVALTGVDLVAEGEAAAFALCRPPGHHAGSSFMGGYCFINNAAVAAEAFVAKGAARVAILDVDYHHGNGTQEIFYARDDVLVVNLHADPLQEYPYFLGFADETGVGRGEGFNLNLPMPHGTDYARFAEALEAAIARIGAFGPDVLVVSLGVDTFEKDPISRFRLISADYPRIGAMIARIPAPTLFVMEGGYAVAEIGVNAVGVLTGWEEGR